MTTFLRFNDLCERRIVRNRTTLYRWIKERGFPSGILLGENTRAWPEEDVEAWLAEQARQSASAPEAA